MAYTTVSIVRPGSAWDGIVSGSEEWASTFGTVMGVLAEHSAEQLANYWVPGVAANVSIQTYPDRNTALRCQQQMASRGFLEYQHAGEGIPMEEMVGIISGD